MVEQDEVLLTALAADLVGEVQNTVLDFDLFEALVEFLGLRGRIMVGEQ